MSDKFEKHEIHLFKNHQLNIEHQKIQIDKNQPHVNFLRFTIELNLNDKPNLYFDREI